MHSRELVLPGSPSEMSEFEQHAINLAQYSVLCTLPSVNVHIPSKKFLQTLYHRLVIQVVCTPMRSNTCTCSMKKHAHIILLAAC